jgi:hypothetical protein
MAKNDLFGLGLANSSCAGLPRASTPFFVEAAKTWMAPQLGLARAAQYELPQVG